MAEDEIRKHTKAAYKAWNDPHKGWKAKFKEILLEIAIIVFAVSLSIGFHNWSESLKERKEEKEFLMGLKDDLKKDTAEMASDSRTYGKVIQAYSYFRKIGLGEALHNDSLAQYRFTFFNTTQFIPNISRFEGLKASGKLDIIENQELLNHILDLYQEDIPFLNFVNQSFNQFKTASIMTFIESHAVLDGKDSIINFPDILHQPQMRMLLSRGAGVRGNIQQYQKCINESVEIMREIDEEFK